MASSTYLGPADNLFVGDKLYHPGDTIPLSDAARRHLEINGHRFSDTDADAVALAAASMAPIAVDTRPRDDRGAPVEVPTPAPTRAAKSD